MYIREHQDFYERLFKGLEYSLMWGAISFLSLGAIGVGGGSYLAYNKIMHPSKRFEIEKNAQEGYVRTSDLEIITRDLDSNGKKETIVQYKGIDYLFIIDSEGKPQISEFSVKPAEVQKK